MIGIDLGTTNSVLSIFKDKKPHTIAIDDDPLLPSVVHLSDSGFVVGKTAKNLLILEPEKTIASIKRKMGKDVQLTIGDRQMRPEEISSVILKKIKVVACTELDVDPNEPLRAVITVPAYFTEEQRQATKQAAALAGLTVERIINEPTAAALAFGISNLEEAIYAVYDLGGGTFDVSVIESDAGMVEVLSTTGNNELGGDDFDRILADFIWEKFAEKKKMGSQQPDRRTRARLLQIAEKTKISLSENETVDIAENFFMTENKTVYHLEETISRDDFENLIEKKIEETVELLQQAVVDAKLKWKDLNGILLVGGSSRIPLVQEIIEEKTGILPQLVDNPDEAVAHGAAIQGAIIDGIDIDTVLVDITPYSLGVGIRDDIADMSLMIATQEEDFDPDDYEINLGVEVLIKKNSAIPAKNTKRFYATSPYQEKFKIKVVQGEYDRVNENKLIGECLLEVENPVERPEVDVTFSLDINGIFDLEAVEINSGKKVTATFKSSRGQKLEESKVVKFDEENTLADEIGADSILIERVEKVLENNNLDEADREELEDALDRFMEVQKQNNSYSAEEIQNEILDLLHYLEDQ